MDGLRQREVAASKAAAECQEMVSELQEFAAHQQAQIQQLTQQMEVLVLSCTHPLVSCMPFRLKVALPSLKLEDMQLALRLWSSKQKSQWSTILHVRNVAFAAHDRKTLHNNLTAFCRGVVGACRGQLRRLM